jgi:hypothetical protein
MERGVLQWMGRRRMVDGLMGIFVRNKLINIKVLPSNK